MTSTFNPRQIVASTLSVLALAGTFWIFEHGNLTFGPESQLVAAVQPAHSGPQSLPGTYSRVDG